MYQVPHRERRVRCLLLSNTRGWAEAPGGLGAMLAQILFEGLEVITVHPIGLLALNWASGKIPQWQKR